MFKISAKTFANARADIQRLNGLLAELRLEEQRCQLAKARLEAERARVQSFVDLCELAQKFDATSAFEKGPAVTIAPLDSTKPDGVKTVTIRKPDAIRAKREAPAVKLRQKRKPDGLPTLVNMVLAVLENGTGELEGMRPREIAEIVRRMWWPDVRTPAVGATAWKLAGEGRLEKAGSFYRLNGRGRDE